MRFLIHYSSFYRFNEGRAFPKPQRKWLSWLPTLHNSKETFQKSLITSPNFSLEVYKQWWKIYFPVMFTHTAAPPTTLSNSFWEHCFFLMNFSKERNLRCEDSLHILTHEVLEESYLIIEWHIDFDDGTMVRKAIIIQLHYVKCNEFFRNIYWSNYIFTVGVEFVFL